MLLAVFSHTPLSPYLPRPSQTASSLAFYLSINITPPPKLLLSPTPSLSALTLTSLCSPPPPLNSLFPCLLSGNPFTSPLSLSDGRKVMSHRLRYVNNRWLMDLGYAQIPVLLIWQSSDGINIEGGKDKKGVGGVNNSSLFCVLYRTINGAVIPLCIIQ